MASLLTTSILSGSKEPVLVEMFAKDNGAVVNPTADVVSMAFMQNGASPVSGDFKTASWDTDNTSVPPKYSVKCEVGPGGATTLAAGMYQVYVKAIDSPDIPIKRAKGQLLVE